MKFENKLGVVIKVDNNVDFDDFPMPVRGDLLSNREWVAWKKMIAYFFRKAGFGAFEPLIKENEIR